MLNQRITQNRGFLPELNWLVHGAAVTPIGSATAGEAAVRSLVHEARVHKELLKDVMTFLKGVPNTPRAKFLLNVPECIFHEEGKAILALCRS